MRCAGLRKRNVAEKTLRGQDPYYAGRFRILRVTRPKLQSAAIIPVRTGCHQEISTPLATSTGQVANPISCASATTSSVTGSAPRISTDGPAPDTIAA